jgi:hypothetical protein
MSNHYHLFLETPEASLVAGMSWLQNCLRSAPTMQNALVSSGE